MPITIQPLSTAQIYMGAIYFGTPTKISITIVDEFSLLTVNKEMTFVLTPTGILNTDAEIGDMNLVYIQTNESNNLLYVSCINDSNNIITVYSQEILSYGMRTTVFI